MNQPEQLPLWATWPPPPYRPPAPPDFTLAEILRGLVKGVLILPLLFVIPVVPGLSLILIEVVVLSLGKGLNLW